MTGKEEIKTKNTNPHLPSLQARPNRKICSCTSCLLQIRITGKTKYDLNTSHLLTQAYQAEATAILLFHSPPHASASTCASSYQDLFCRLPGIDQRDRVVPENITTQVALKIRT